MLEKSSMALKSIDLSLTNLGFRVLCYKLVFLHASEVRLSSNDFISKQYIFFPSVVGINH